MEKIKTGIVGCGAISKNYHLPVLAGHDGFVLTALVDINPSIIKDMAKQYKIKHRFESVSELNNQIVDAVVIATPPKFHAPLAIELLNKGIHVFVEKPMALTFEESQAMVETAENNNVCLVAGYFRRLYPSTRLAKQLIETSYCGEVVSFDAEEGGIFDWPSATLGAMSKEVSGGGVLIDTGSHTLDQIMNILPGEYIIDSYQDDSFGGIESECKISISTVCNGRQVRGHLKLSRLRKMKNSIKFHCEKGDIDLFTNNNKKLTITTVDNQQEKVNPENIVFDVYSPDEMGIYDTFRAEFDEWKKGIQGQNYNLSGDTALPVVSFIQKSYNTKPKLKIDEPWVDGPVVSDFLKKMGFPLDKTKQKILVTGGSGFIGCRLCELMVLSESYDVRAMVHNPGRASRLSRLPVEMIQCDITDVKQVQNAVQGCDAVIHCAYGTSWGERKEIFNVTVNGTKNLINAAQGNGISQFIHLSTIAIHGNGVQGKICSDTGINHGGDTYAESKALAEQEVLKAVESGLRAVILRLANVYGPYSGPFTIRPVQHLADDIPVLLGEGSHSSNIVYVDNVCEAIFRALGNIINLSGEIIPLRDVENVTWAHYHGKYAKWLRKKMSVTTIDEFDALKIVESKKSILYILKRYVNESYRILKSPEMVKLLKRILDTDPLGKIPKIIIKRFPNLKKVVIKDQAFVYHPQLKKISGSEKIPLELLELYNREATVDPAFAKEKLGFESIIDFETAMELTKLWLKKHSYL